jgi:hypothetical protein
MYESYDIGKNRKAHCTYDSVCYLGAYNYLKIPRFFRGGIKSPLYSHTMTLVEIECPRKSNLLFACLLICQLFWCFDQQIWISQNFSCCAFLCPGFTMKSVCLSVVFFFAGFLLCLSKMRGGMHPPLHSTPSSLRASSVATFTANFDCLYNGRQSMGGL